jgi:hypothetical protein
METTHMSDFTSGVEFWPPRRKSMAELVYAAPVPAEIDPRYHAGRWHEVIEERTKQQVADYAKVDADYARRHIEREEAENKANRERANALRQGNGG